MGVEGRRIALERKSCIVELEAEFGLELGLLPALSFKCSSLVDDHSTQNCGSFILTGIS